MSVKSDSNEYLYLAYLTEPRKVGEATKRSPQHLTLVPPFPNTILVTDIIKVMDEVANETAPFEIIIAEEAKFGPNHNINVRLVKSLEVLRTLHSLLMYKLESIGVKLPAKYVYKEYIPHITVKPAHTNQPKEGDIFTVNHLALMHKNKGFRTLLAKKDLLGV